MSPKPSPDFKLTTDAITSHAERWRKIGLSHGPTDKAKVREGVAKIYRLAKMTPPSYIFWLSSPATGALATALLSKKTGRGFEPNVRFFYESLQKNLKKVIERRDDREQWFEAEKELHRQIYKGYGEIVPELRRALQIQLTIGTAARAAANEGVGVSRQEGVLDELLNQLVVEMDVQLPPHLADTLKPLRAEAWQLNQTFAAALAATWDCHLGSLDTDLPFFELCAASGLKLPSLDGFLTLAQSCGWWWPLKECCIVSARPQVTKVDDDGKLHSPNGPALQYMDGWGVTAWHGQLCRRDF